MTPRRGRDASFLRRDFAAVVSAEADSVKS
jgi:hypothetical protein